MKDYLQMIAVTGVLLLLIPLVAFAGRKSASPSSAEVPDSEAPDAVTILFRETGEIVSMTPEEYAAGAVFAQMPADFSEEALKAQAVLAYTYAERRRLLERQSPAPELHGALMSDDTSLYQAFFTEEQAKAVYGESYEEARRRITEAAESVRNVTLCYEGEPVIAAFHGISFGYTESALTMWGEDIPYLQSSESAADAQLEVCRSVSRFSDSQIAEFFPELPEEDISGLAAAELSEHGTVLSLKAGGSLIDSQEFAEKLRLPSRHFMLTRVKDGWEIETLGCGHLVGMSQYGAESMAEEGHTYAEILLHYYKDCILVRGQ